MDSFLRENAMAEYQMSLVEPWFPFLRVWSSHNPHRETKQTWYAAELYQKGTMRHFKCHKPTKNPAISGQ